jgi:hypothetical protein
VKNVFKYRYGVSIRTGSSDVYVLIAVHIDL